MFQRNFSPTSSRLKGWMAGLGGITFLSGMLLFGSWHMPFQSLAEVSQESASASVGASALMSQKGFSQIAAAVTPAVVNITVRKEAPVPMSGIPSEPWRDFFGMPGMPEMPRMPNRPGFPPAPEGLSPH